MGFSFLSFSGLFLKGMSQGMHLEIRDLKVKLQEVPVFLLEPAAFHAAVKYNCT